MINLTVRRDLVFGRYSLSSGVAFGDSRGVFERFILRAVLKISDVRKNKDDVKKYRRRLKIYINTLKIA